MATKTASRRYDLDWLRIIGILAVFVFHSVRFFTYEDWHVKNPALFGSAQTITDALNYWIMPFIFVISGASLYLSLQKGKAGKFMLDKVLRLLVPLVVGVFTHSILQVYLERLTHGQFTGSFFEFLPRYFDGIYGFGGNFAAVGMHLWYLLVLFMFSIGLLPLFMLLKTNLGERIVNKVASFFAIPGLIYLVALPLTLANHADPDSFLGFDKFNWNLAVYILDLLAGYMIISSERLQKTIIRLRWISLVGMVATTIIGLLTGELDELIQWSTILTLMGFGMKYLNFTNPFQKYAAETVLPFYILHQTVLLAVGYFVVRWQMPDLLKWAVIAALSLAAILLIYEYLVRRVPVMRFLFGMRVIKKSAPAAQPSIQPVVEKL